MLTRRREAAKGKAVILREAKRSRRIHKTWRDKSRPSPSPPPLSRKRERGSFLRGFAPPREVIPGWRFAYPGYDCCPLTSDL